MHGAFNFEELMPIGETNDTPVSPDFVTRGPDPSILCRDAFAHEFQYEFWA
jgi:hypothetical protein